MKGYTPFYWDVPEKFNLNPTEALLLTYIKNFTRGKRGYCYASKKYLAETLNVDPSTIFKALNTLEEKQLIVREFDSTFRSGKIYVCAIYDEFIEEKDVEIRELKKEK